MNPLKQYFRRPAIFLKLPSGGKFYPEGALEMPPNEELPVYPMTAIDELTSKTPDSLFNGTAIVEIIKSCVPAIKDPWHIPAVDLNAILIAIRAASSGNTLDIESECPKCENTGSYGVDLPGLLQNIKCGNYDAPLIIGDLAIRFKPLNYQALNETNMTQFETQMMLNSLQNITNDEERLKQTSATMRKVNENLFHLVATSIESISLPGETVTNTNFIYEFILNTDKQTFEQIRSHGIKLREHSDIKPLKIKCVNCSHDYEQQLTLNATDFFG